MQASIATPQRLHSIRFDQKWTRDDRSNTAKQAPSLICESQPHVTLRVRPSDEQSHGFELRGSSIRRYIAAA